jgi:hypothetical protein
MIEVNGKNCRVRVIAHSVADMLQNKKEIFTLELRYWRSIHAELMTHRDFSRNAGSSRAIPTAKIIQQVREEPAGPIHWGANQPGMQANRELTGAYLENAKALWLQAANEAADKAEAMLALGLHKQVANRILEPFQFINVLVTSTEWDNWFKLRAHADAQPEIQDLAYTMREAMGQSRPVKRRMEDRGNEAGWHLPYVLDSEREYIRLDVLKKLSTARSARTSYEPFDGNASIDKEIARYELLVGSEPLHASPTEHQAAPEKLGSMRCRNFTGWHQHRADVETAACRRAAGLAA